MGVHAAFGGDTRMLWYSEIDRDAAALLAQRAPGVPNIGDLTACDWGALPPVDVVTAGFPCQPVSSAGRQQAQADHRWLWPHVLKAVTVLRPQELILENVRNLISIQNGTVFAAILADLQAARYAVRWATAGACAVGSCHHRHRVFLVARDTWQLTAPPAQRIPMIECGARRGRSRLLLPTPTASRYGNNRGGANPDGPVRPGLDAVHQLLPTPTSSDGKNGPGCPGREGGDNLRTGVLELAGTAGGYRAGSVYADRRAAALIAEQTLLPTPRVRDYKGAETPDVLAARRAAGTFQGGDSLPTAAVHLMPAGEQTMLPTPCVRDYKTGFNHDRGRVEGAQLPDVAQQHLSPRQVGPGGPLLPTPRASDAHNGSPNQHGGRGMADLMLPSAVIGQRYGRYAHAVELWQGCSGVPAPQPTMLNAAGQWRLDPRLPEWMMGYPPGWITDLAERLPSLRMAGNGVVPHVVAAVYPLIVDGWDYPRGGAACQDLNGHLGSGGAGPDRTAGARPGRAGTAAAHHSLGPAVEQLALI